MEESDLLYLAKNLAQLLGVPTRLYRGEKPIFFYATASLPKDPFSMHADCLRQGGPNLSYFCVDDFFYYVQERSGQYQFIVGPFRYFAPEKQTLRELAFRLDVPKNEITSFIDGMLSITCMPLEAVLQSMMTFNFVLNGERLGLNDLMIAPSMQEEIVQKQEEAKIMPPDLITQERNSTLSIEQTIERFVETGDAEGFREWAKSAPSIRSGSLSKDYIRHEKNTFIVSTTLASRAAIRGGLPYNEAMDIADSYIKQCEAIRLYPEISNLNYRMMEDYIGRVRDVRSSASPLASKVTSYVYRHLSEPIGLDDLSKEFSMAKSNLCLRFKKETGTTISKFVASLKVGECTRLLRTTEKPISSISSYLGFSSPSHLTKVYKTVTGRNPKEVRKQEKIISPSSEKPMIFVSKIGILRNESEFQRGLALLSEKEKKQMNSYRLEDDRLRFLGSRLLLRTGFERLGIDLAKEEISISESGKPFLVSGHKEFNISHSGEYVCVGFDQAPIGIDVQANRPVSSSLWNAFCESERTAAQKEGRPDRALLKLWSGKEALSKQSGLGLKKPFSSTDLSSFVTSRSIEQKDQGENLVLSAFDLGDAWLAVASKEPVTEFLFVAMEECLP